MRRKFQKAKPKENTIKFFANDRIRAQEVFLIDENGENIGPTPTFKALQIAREAELDLVEVNPKANPPVAKIMNFSQFRYEQDKKAHKQKMQQKKVETKEIRLSLRISQHDSDVRLEQAKKFLEKGDKVKIDLMLKGRERQLNQKAVETINSFVNSLKQAENMQISEEQGLTKQGARFTIILTNK